MINIDSKNLGKCYFRSTEEFSKFFVEIAFQGTSLTCLLSLHCQMHTHVAEIELTIPPVNNANKGSLTHFGGVSDVRASYMQA